MLTMHRQQFSGVRPDNIPIISLNTREFFLVSPNETTHGNVSKLFVRHSCVDVRKYFWKPHC